MGEFGFTLCPCTAPVCLAQYQGTLRDTGQSSTATLLGICSSPLCLFLLPGSIYSLSNCFILSTHHPWCLYFSCIMLLTSSQRRNEILLLYWQGNPLTASENLTSSFNQINFSRSCSDEVVGSWMLKDNVFRFCPSPYPSTPLILPLQLKQTQFSCCWKAGEGGICSHEQV